MPLDCFGSLRRKLNSYSNARHQIFAALTVQILTFSHGVGVGWLSPTLQKLLSEDSPVSFPVGIVEASWIGATLGLGSLAGNIFFGLLLDRLGRKFCIYLLAMPFIAQWILTYFAQSVEFLYVARFLGGVTGGGNYVVIPIFISEIAHNNIRGALASMAMLMLSFGILAGYLFSSYVPYKIVPLIILIYPILYLIAAYMIPETPQYLIKRKRFEAAEKSYHFYNQVPAEDPAKEKAEEPNDFEILKNSLLKCNENGVQESETVSLKDFTSPEALKSFLSALVLMATNQFSGSFAMFNYSSDIFAATGTTIEPNTCTITIGIIQIIGTFSAMVLVDRFGRKSLFLTSACGMTLGMTTLGLYVQFVPRELQDQYTFVPLVLMMIIAYIASTGIISLIFVIIVEIMPMKIRSLATSICMALMSSMVFLTLKMYPIFIYKFGISFTMYFCSSACLIGGIYLLIFLPASSSLWFIRC